MARKSEKSVADMSIEERLKNLYQLQTILSKIDEIRTIRGELPLEVQDLEDEVEGLRTRIEKTNQEKEEIHRNKNHWIAERESALKKKAESQERLNNIRNNREYDLVNKEMEFQNLEHQLAEKRIKECDQAEKQKDLLIEKSLEELDNRNKDLEVKKNELDEIVIETKAEEDKLRDKAKSLEMTIEPRILQAFKRIRKNSHNGLGIVCVQRDACGGCFAKIPPQRQLDVRIHKKIIVCEYCGRILVDPELAGITPLEAKEEKPRRKRATRKKVEESEG